MSFRPSHARAAVLVDKCGRRRNDASFFLFLATATEKRAFAAAMHRGDAVTATRTNSLAFRVHLQKGTVLFVQRVLVRGILRLDGLHGVRQNRTHRLVEPAPFLVVKRGGAAQRANARFEEDLVGIGIADAGHHRLIAEHVLYFAAVLAQTSRKRSVIQLRLDYAAFAA